MIGCGVDSSTDPWWILVGYLVGTLIGLLILFGFLRIRRWWDKKWRTF